MMRGNSIFRPFLQRRGSISSSSRFIETLISNPKTISSSPTSSFPKIPSSSSSSKFQFSHQFQRTLCSPSEPSDEPYEAPANVVPIKTEEEFNSSLSKVQAESLPAMFYFTAGWCAPCRFFFPVIGVLSGRYPHVTTYKIDIDQEGLQSTLSKLNITSVPTVHLFQNGEKADEIIGADVARLKNTMEKLYK